MPVHAVPPALTQRTPVGVCRWQEALAKRAHTEFTPQAAGIGGILSRLGEARDTEAALATQAFSGMTALVNNAKQIVRDEAPAVAAAAPSPRARILVLACCAQVRMAESYAARVTAATARRDAAPAGGTVCCAPQSWRPIVPLQPYCSLLLQMAA